MNLVVFISKSFIFDSNKQKNIFTVTWTPKCFQILFLAKINISMSEVKKFSFDYVKLKKPSIT